MINYNGKTFRSIENTPNGEVSGTTFFHYEQDGNLVWASYSGGSIKLGKLIATVNEKGELDMRYQHLNSNLEFRMGKCHSTPEILPDGRIRLYENWQWLNGDLSTGSSIIEETQSADI
ncbi:MAG: n-acetylglutamate synthase [Bacteroidota bacterium]